jgi:hypothetical protein
VTRERIAAAVLRSAFILALAAIPVGAADLPVWPHEQQALLLTTEDELLQVQRKLFAARQRHDQTSIDELGQQFKELQEKRRQLIELTRDQLPSQ